MTNRFLTNVVFKVSHVSRFRYADKVFGIEFAPVMAWEWSRPSGGMKQASAQGGTLKGREGGRRTKKAEPVEFQAPRGIGLLRLMQRLVWWSSWSASTWVSSPSLPSPSL
jgi:hypothetical protein